MGRDGDAEYFMGRAGDGENFMGMGTILFTVSLSNS